MQGVRGRRRAREAGGNAKVLKRREKWQTLSCHEALDVFILPQAVLEERSLPVRCSPRPRAHTRARAAADGGFAKSFKFVRNAGPSCSKDAGFDWRQARRLPAASSRNSRNRTLSAMLARSRGSHVKSQPRTFALPRNIFNEHNSLFTAYMR